MARSYVGSLVRIRRDMQTNGGTKFRAGTLMRVCHSDNQGLMLSCYRMGNAYTISGVSKYSVEVVEWSKRKRSEEAEIDPSLESEED